MSENRYESKITRAIAPVGQVYGVLSNLQNLEKVKHLIPEDKVNDIEIRDDAIRFKIDGLGQKICVKIIERAENNYIKFALENMPVQAHFWIQTKEVAPDDTRLKLTIGADLPMMFRMMLEQKIRQGLDQAADMLAQLPYDKMSGQC